MDLSVGVCAACMRLQMHLSVDARRQAVCVSAGHAGLSLNAKSTTWSQIGPQPDFRSPPSFGKEWDYS